MLSLVSLLCETATESAADIRKEINNIKYGPIRGNKETIKFSFRGQEYLGFLKGRNKDLLLGFGIEKDQAIACRVLLDGHAEEVEEKACVDAIWV